MVCIHRLQRVAICVVMLTVANTAFAQQSTRYGADQAPRPPIVCTDRLDRVHKSQCRSRTMAVRVCQRGPVIVRVTQQCLGG